MLRFPLEYDASFSHPNTFFVLNDGRTIRMRITCCQAPEVVTQTMLRWRHQATGATFVRPLTPDLDLWLTESVALDGLPRADLLLRNVPEHVGDTLKRL